MRIISGKLKGRVINPPKNLRARPTTDFAKENLFNVLNSVWEFEGLEVLDLFAGTGSMSYEFASRGAASVVSVEINAVHFDYIRRTAAEFGLDNVHPVKANAFLYLKSVEKRFDMIFADPPYDIHGVETIPELVFGRRLLNEGGWLILEHSRNYDFSTFPNFLQLRSYGSVHFSVFQN